MSGFDDALDGFDSRLRDILPIALTKGAEFLRGESAPLVPVESGHLVESGGVRTEGLTAEVYYPGPYARYQHYELQLRHPHGQALYLEQPTIEKADEVVKVIADEIGTVL